MGDLVWVIFFSQDFFSATYDGVRIFSSIIRQERYFFSVQDICFQEISLQHITFPPNQSAGYFFLKSPITTPRTTTTTPLKRQMVVNNQVRPHFLSNGYC